MSAPPVCRVGDLSTPHYPAHGPMPATQGSPNTYGNYPAIHRIGDAWSQHNGRLSSGSSSVFCNLTAVGRIGDSISCGARVLTGSSNIFVG